MIIRNIKHADIEMVLKLSSNEFGEGFHTKEHVLKYVDRDDALAIGIFQSDEILGLAFTELMDIDSFNRKINRFPNNKSLPERFIYLDSIMINSRYQKKGLGSKLMGACLERIDPSKTLVSLGWKNKNGINVQSLFLKYGFEMYDEIKDIWTENCDAGKFECPYKTGPCDCSVRLFVRE